ncbi:MAG: hypothetical protein AVDCRST_MAG22-602, partial [uncultured Rubrobacteraceae bacterium]
AVWAWYGDGRDVPVSVRFNRDRGRSGALGGAGGARRVPSVPAGQDRAPGEPHLGGREPGPADGGVGAGPGRAAGTLCPAPHQHLRVAAEPLDPPGPDGRARRLSGPGPEGPLLQRPQDPERDVPGPAVAGASGGSPAPLV